MINKHFIVGRVGQDPDLKYTSNNTPVVSFSVATTETWKGKDGQKHEETTWHDIEAWQRLAEICGEYLSKGSLVHIEGSVVKQKWTDNEGNKRVTVKTKARDMKILSGGGSAGSESGGYQAPQEPQEPQGGFPDTGEDVPF